MKATSAACNEEVPLDIIFEAEESEQETEDGYNLDEIDSFYRGRRKPSRSKYEKFSNDLESDQNDAKGAGHSTRHTHENISVKTNKSGEAEESGKADIVTNYWSTEEIKRKQGIFCERFVKTFNRKKSKYQSLLSQLRINCQSCDQEEGTVKDCESEDEVEIVVSEKNRKAMCIRNSFRFGRRYNFSRIIRHIFQSIRRHKASRIMCAIDDVPEDDYDEVLRSVSSELSVAFEYQIAVLADDNEVQKVADHAVCCMMRYLKSSESVFNATNLLQAVLDETPKFSFKHSDRVLKTKIFESESFGLKNEHTWRLYEILKQPGIRVFDSESSAYKYYGCFTPFGFLCRPNKYGFRGPLHIWNEEERKYTMIPNDITSCVSVKRREVEYDSCNKHHSYLPTSSCSHDTVDLAGVYIDI